MDRLVQNMVYKWILVDTVTDLRFKKEWNTCLLGLQNDHNALWV